MLDRPDATGTKDNPIVVKKYANRRLYNTETSTYVTLEDLAEMVRSDRDFVVQDAKSGDDLTHAVLTQIIVEQESRANGQSLLPVPFLRQLIRFYDDIGFGRIVPSYLQMSIETLTREQERFRKQMTQSWAPGTFDAYREQARKNLALFEQAMSVWTPNTATDHQPSTPSPTAGGETSVGDTNAQGDNRTEPNPASAEARPRQESPELSELRNQLDEMQRKIEQLAKSRNEG
ncbi:MAG: polyhydroxyalkanoate synthesis repressor PhaR [Pseudomonadota bacterium]